MKRIGRLINRKLQARKTVCSLVSRAIDGTVYGTVTTGTRVANGSSITLKLTTPAEHDIIVNDVIVHLQDGVSTRGDLIIYEAPVTGGTPSELTPRNYNRQTGDNSTVTVTSGDTYTSGGTAILLDVAFGNRGAASSNVFPAILKKSTNYLAVFTNNSGQVADMLMRVVYTEEVEV
jgi:hypothetical protein